MTPQPGEPHKLPAPVPTPNPELAAPPERYAHSWPTLCESGVPSATIELPAVSDAEPALLGNVEAGVGTALNPTLVSTLAWELATSLLVT
jgi:hypothetical protein